MTSPIPGLPGDTTCTMLLRHHVTEREMIEATARAFSTSKNGAVRLLLRMGYSQYADMGLLPEITGTPAPPMPGQTAITDHNDEEES